MSHQKIFQLTGLLLLTFAQAWGGTSLWQPVPMVTGESLSAGNRGGEGCQTIQNFAIDSTGAFLMMATNVGGLYRSLDNGASWEPSNVGFSPRGGAALAIDPNNSRRVLVVGANSGRSSVNGLWLSTDQASSWKPVLLQNTKAAETYHDSVAFDASSKKKGPGGPSSSTAYWVAYSDAGGGLWKSGDGGRTWRKIQAGFSDGIVKVNPADGTVYVATAKGFFRSTDHGKSFLQVVEGPVLGLDVIATRPQNVYLNKTDGAYLSVDAGKTFASTGNAGLPSGDQPGLKNLKVSPANPDHLLINDDQGTYYKQGHYYSDDGGKSWSACKLDDSQSFIPTNDRPWLFIWDPVKGDKAWSCGGGYVTQTTDGGAHFAWANNGFNGLTCAGIFNFNPQNPGLLLLTSQDTNSTFTQNVGASPATWQYLDVSGKSWGGFNYGGYALNADVMFAGNSPDWDAPATLMVSTNGGGRWKDKGLVGNSTQTACGDPADPSTAFWDQYRTVDAGKTWEGMPDCDGVFTYNSDPKGGHELYGAKGRAVVLSSDHGNTWKTVVRMEEKVLDLAYDWKDRKVYIATGSLFQFDPASGMVRNLSFRLGKDNGGNQKAISVAVDPVHPNVVYAAWHGDKYLSRQSVRRSLDGGETWRTLTLQPGDKGLDGGLESQCVRVDPATGWLYSAGSCFGLWRYPPPSFGK